MPKKKKGGSNASVSPAASVASNDDRPAASVASEDGSLSSKSELPGNYSGDLDTFFDNIDGYVSDLTPEIRDEFGGIFPYLVQHNYKLKQMIIIVRLIKSGITTAELLPLLRPLELSRVTSEVLTAENTAELNKMTSTVKEKEAEKLVKSFAIDGSPPADILSRFNDAMTSSINTGGSTANFSVINMTQLTAAGIVALFGGTSLLRTIAEDDSKGLEPHSDVTVTDITFGTVLSLEDQMQENDASSSRSDLKVAVTYIPPQLLDSSLKPLIFTREVKLNSSQLTLFNELYRDTMLLVRVDQNLLFATKKAAKVMQQVQHFVLTFARLLGQRHAKYLNLISSFDKAIPRIGTVVSLSDMLPCMALFAIMNTSSISGIHEGLYAVQKMVAALTMSAGGSQPLAQNVVNVYTASQKFTVDEPLLTQLLNFKILVSQAQQATHAPGAQDQIWAGFSPPYIVQLICLTLLSLNYPDPRDTEARDKLVERLKNGDIITLDALISSVESLSAGSNSRFAGKFHQSASDGATAFMTYQEDAVKFAVRTQVEEQMAEFKKALSASSKLPSRAPAALGGQKPASCNNFRMSGSCKFGDSCRFSHETSQQHVPVQQTPLQKFYDSMNDIIGAFFVCDIPVSSYFELVDVTIGTKTTTTWCFKSESDGRPMFIPKEYLIQLSAKFLGFADVFKRVRFAQTPDANNCIPELIIAPLSRGSSSLRDYPKTTTLELRPSAGSGRDFSGNPGRGAPGRGGGPGRGGPGRGGIGGKGSKGGRGSGGGRGSQHGVAM